MRIAQVMLAKQFGGAERSFVDLCAALGRRGHDVLAVCERRGVAQRHLADVPGVACTCVDVLGSWDLRARFRLKRVLQSFAPAVAQMHLARAAALAGPAARALGIPTLAKTHNYVDLKYYRAIDHLVPTTRKQAAFLRSAGIPATRITRIPNFSSLVPRPRPTGETEASHAPLRAVAIGRMVTKKGFDVLIDALAQVRADGRDVTLAIAGDGPESDRLHDQRERLELSRSVRFLGWQDAVAPVLETADVFVLPSRDEPFGIVCLEAMALEVPIIATRTDGPVEFLDEHTAVLLDPDDSRALAAALAGVMDDPRGARARAVRARERFEREFSEAVVVGAYETLYARLAGVSGSDETGVA